MHPGCLSGEQVLLVTAAASVCCFLRRVWSQCAARAVPMVSWPRATRVMPLTVVLLGSKCCPVPCCWFVFCLQVLDRASSVATCHCGTGDVFNHVWCAHGAAWGSGACTLQPVCRTSGGELKVEVVSELQLPAQAVVHAVGMCCWVCMRYPAAVLSEEAACCVVSLVYHMSAFLAHPCMISRQPFSPVNMC